MIERRFVPGGIAVFALVSISVVAGAQDISIFSTFDTDTPGALPATGGADQPTGIAYPWGGVLVQSSANGIATQPLEAADTDCSASPSPSFYYGGVYYELHTPVTNGVLRIEATVAVNQLTTGIFFDTDTEDSGPGIARLQLNGLGQITDNVGTVLGDYTANTPLRFRADIDMASKTWACTIDDELNGFEDDMVMAGLAFTNDPAIINQVGRVHLVLYGSFNIFTCTPPRSVAYDDVLITTQIFADGFESGNTARWSSTVPPPSERLVIFDGGGVSGIIGGRAGADAHCFSAAQSMPGIAGAATTRALISVSVSDEIRDMPGNYGVPIDRPITSHHGLAVSNNWAELLDGSIDQNLASSGVLPSGAFWYSGSLENGSAAITTCSGWTDGSSPFGGRYGSSSFADGRWIDTGDATCGSQLYHVLCLAWD